MPRPAWGPADIEVRLGAPFVTTDDYVAFFASELGLGSRVVHEERTATWSFDFIEMLGSEAAAKAKRWSTPEVDAIELIEASMRQVAIEVYDINKRLRWDATLAARALQRDLNERFADWVWEDRKRARRVVAAFNQRFPRRPREAFRGSESHWKGYAGPHVPRERQKAAVGRIVACVNRPTGVLLNHVVGAGKTLTMAAAARVMKRAGLIDKPMMVVPNHMLVQVANEIATSFPDMTLLTGATPAEVAACDADLVIVTHAWFAKVKPSSAAMAGYKRTLAIDAELVVDSDDAEWLDGRSKATLRSRAKRARKALEAVEPDDGWVFDDLGVDYLLVDEAHYYKRLSFPSRVGSFGVGSRRANEMAAKLWFLRDRYGAARATFATGTPQSNTIAEVYTWQMLLAPEELRAAGIFSFDAWVAVFAEQRPAIELGVDLVSYRLTNRLARFHNVGALQDMLATFCDTATAADLKLERPVVRVETMAVAPSPELVAFQAELAERVLAIRDRALGASGDNVLAVCTASRLASLDVRLVGGPAPSDGGKPRAVAKRLAAELELDPGALFIVFADLGTPRPGDDGVYGWLRDELVVAGVPRERVRFVHEASSAQDKERLFADCRAGNVSVVVGSTEKLGIGTNIQDRAKGGVHLDIGWKPDVYHQRRGRYERSGNRYGEVIEWRVVTVDSFDAPMWQANDRKAAAINQLWSGQYNQSSIDDLDDSVIGFADVLAVAFSDDQLVSLDEIAGAVARLRRERRAWRFANTGPWPDEAELQRALKRQRELEQLISTQTKRKAA